MLLAVISFLMLQCDFTHDLTRLKDLNDWTIGNGCDSEKYIDVFINSDITLKGDCYLYNSKLTVHGNINYNGFDIIFRCPTDELIVTGFPLSNKSIERKQFEIYPNPTNNIFYIKTNKKYKLEIYDLFGKLVSRSNNIEELSSGLYFVNITIDDLLVTKKIIKQ